MYSIIILVLISINCKTKKNENSPSDSASTEVSIEFETDGNTPIDSISIEFSIECENNLNDIFVTLNKLINNQLNSDIKIDSVLCANKDCIKNISKSSFQKHNPNLIFEDSTIVLKVISIINKHHYTSNKLIFKNNRFSSLGFGRSFVPGMSMRDHYSNNEEFEKHQKHENQMYYDRFNKYLDCFNK